jgi:hypothetical protein
MVGLAWPNFLEENLKCTVDMAHSTGAGNEMNIEKVKHLLNNSPDLLIVQLTDPGRYTVGIANPVAPKNSKDLIDSHFIRSSCYYTFNPHSNNENIEQTIGRKVDVDDFIINHVITSDYNLNYKIMHTISTMAFLARAKNVPIVFFSWCVDIHGMISKYGYTDFFRDLLIIPGYIEEFVAENNLLPVPHGEYGAGHHSYVNQKRICQEYILPYLKEKNLI